MPADIVDKTPELADNQLDMDHRPILLMSMR
jgi:hypothetical protein